MAFCLKCRAEYEEGYDICCDCNEKLLDVLPEVLPKKYAEPVFLCSVSDGIEVEIKISLLEAEGIRVIKKPKEAGGYLKVYMGSSIYGMDLYVEKNLYDKANEILSATPIMPEDEYFDQPENSEYEYYNRENIIKKWYKLYIYFFAAIFASAIIYAIVNTIRFSGY